MLRVTLGTEEWDFSSPTASKNSIIDKIYFVRYGVPSDPFYVKLGALDRVDLGYGILVNGYSNSILYPQDRKVGLNVKRTSSSYEVQAFSNDLKENLGIIGARVSSRKLLGCLLYTSPSPRDS